MTLPVKHAAGKTLVTQEELHKIQLDTLYRVSHVLSQSLELQDTLKEVLQILDKHMNFRPSMVTLLCPASGELIVSAIHGPTSRERGEVRYQSGEGIVGRILKQNRPMVIRRIADEPGFLDRLGLFDRHRSFIGVPIHSGDAAVGVLAAQPGLADYPLEEHAQFLEMVANLIVQSVRLYRRVERERLDLTEERDRLRRVVRGKYGFDNVIGRSPRMQYVFELVRQVSKWDTTVLIRGESGTGKELIANAIHYNSQRANGPFVKLNCAALPDNLIESELFGHEKGAFTGAVSQRKGRFELADSGTVFLDEIGEISPLFQSKLLRVVQEGEFERVGGMRTLKTNVRIVAATNVDLEAEVEKGEFREDLYYRLNVMPIYMPSLRERLEDIPLLVEFLIEKLSKIQGRKLEISNSAIRMLMRYEWPGNVRELENTLERAAIMAEDGVIDRDVVSLSGINEQVMQARRSANPAKESILDNLDLDDEKEKIIAALEEAGWVQAKAARLLGMTPRQIAYRIQTLNITVRRI